MQANAAEATPNRPGRIPAGIARLMNRACRFGLRLVVAALYARAESASPRLILVFRTGTIGDMVCALPALAWLRQQFPQASVHLLTAPTAIPLRWEDETFTAGASILADSRLVDHTLLFTGADLKSLRRLRALRQHIRSLDPDRAYLLPRTGERPWRILKKILFLRLLGVRKNLLGYDLDKMFTVFRKAQFLDGGFDHQVTTTLKAVGATANDPVAFPIEIEPAARQRVEKLWREHGLDGKRVIGLFPSAKFEHKRWPLENFLSFCQTLGRDPGIAILLVGGAADKALADQLAARSAAPLVNLAGRTTLAETAEILRRCDLYVGNDSGPAHIAAAVGTPCVTLFSSIVFPGIWEPWGAGHISLRHRVPCEFCFSEDHCPRGTRECIGGIGVEEVLATVKARLSRPSDQPSSAGSPKRNVTEPATAQHGW